MNLPKKTLTILKCQTCGRLAIAIGDIRVTSHKCQGQWAVLHKEPLDLESVKMALAEETEGEPTT